MWTVLYSKLVSKKFVKFGWNSMLTTVNTGLLRTKIKFNQHNLVLILNTKFIEICSNNFEEKHGDRWKGINISAFSGF